MSSQTSSSSFPVTPAQIIDQILDTDTSTPHYLQELVSNIDTLLLHYTNKGKSSATHGMLASVRAGLPSASHVSKFSEEASKNIRLISTQISDYTGDKHSTAISVLTAIANVHWVSVGFLLVAAVLERLDKIKNNKMERLKLLKSMNDLAKVIMQLQHLPQVKKELQAKMNESIELIVNGAIFCCVQKKRKTLESCCKAETDGEELKELRFRVDEMREMLHLEISFNTFNNVQTMVCSRPPLRYHNTAAVGIEHKITEVKNLLEWDNDKPAVTVVVHGIGGAGKTTLAEEVCASLNMQGWKYSKVTLIKNLELHPNIEELQTQILQDLTGIKQETVRDYQTGQQQLNSAIEREDVFLYIDNILKREHLENLLPKHIAKKRVRILATARKTNVAVAFENCGIKPCKLFSIDSLSVEAALQLLCSKIDRERDSNSILAERPQANEIAKKISCCPLFLEVVGSYLHKRNNKVEAYEKILDWLRDGEDFSCDMEDGFEESRILFAYHELRPSAQEAFLDICSFFSDWRWDEVACIVGEEELDCLQEGALVKRIEVENRYTKRKVERISIHDLILTAGRNKAKENRFRRADDFSMALANEGVLCQTKGVWLEDKYKPFHVSAEVLDTMSESLRVFAIGDLTIVDGQCRKKFNELKFLHAARVPNLAIDILKIKHLSGLHYSFKKDEIWSPPKNLCSLQVLNLYGSDGLPDEQNIHRAIEFTHLNKLKHLALTDFHIGEISSFAKVYSLQKLTLYRIQGLKELPGSLVKLRSLRELSLIHSTELKQLPAGFGELSALTSLDLNGCESLQELPCDFERLLALQSLNLSGCSSLLGLPEGFRNLPSLTYIDVNGCKKLSSLPQRVVELSLLKERISFNRCSGLQEIPEDICKFKMLTSLSLEGCISLKMLPIGFSELTCLQELVLKQCTGLQHLGNDFHCLLGLRTLNMSGCKSLSRLPQGFGKLGCLERLDLSKCYKLEELSSDFGCLGALKSLVLSK